MRLLRYEAPRVRGALRLCRYFARHCLAYTDARLFIFMFSLRRHCQLPRRIAARHYADTFSLRAYFAAAAYMLALLRH